MNLDKYYECHSPGYVIEIYNNGKTEEYIYGNKAVIPKVEKATRDTLYDIASLTKVFTATLIYMAYEENLINLNDNIYNINTNFKNLKNVTIIDLLSHNQNIWTNGYLGDANSKEEFYNILYSAYVKDNIPTYVDTHYMILSTILETIYKESFEKICQKKIFDRLNLTNTTFNPKPDMCASNNYQYTSNEVIDYIYPGLIHDTKARIAKKYGVYLGHASIFTTGNDLLKFLKTFLNNELLQKETIKIMLQHRNTNELNLKKLKELIDGNDINEMYEKVKEDNIDVSFPLTYNNMGTRYRNEIKKINDIPNKASNNSITFSGYTGPTFTIDFDNNIIVVIMCNVIHNSKISRKERKAKTTDIMNMIFDDLIKNK